MSITEREQLEQSIAALEAQRAVLGAALVETALAPLRERLAALGPAPAQRAAQRKQVSVLFATIQGLATLGDTLDAEDVGDLMNRLWRELDAVIVAHGGSIDKHIGDSIMAMWGAGQVREDDPEQAVRAALAMREAIANFGFGIAASATAAALQSQIQNPKSEIRIGINTGPVVLGAVGTTGEFTAMGDTVNVASRLEHAAPTGEILISQATYRHVRGLFALTALEPLTVKGKSEPLQVYLVRGILPPALRVMTRGVEGVIAPLVGRDTELDVLTDALRRAQAAAREGPGGVQAVTVVGEAGIGKSRLLEEFDYWLDLQPMDVRYFRGRAGPQTMTTPGALLRDLLDLRFEIFKSDALAVVRAKFEHGVAQFLGPDSAAQAHVLGAWLGYDFSDSPHLSGLVNDPYQLHDRALGALGAFFAAAAHVTGDDVRLSGAVLVLEDLHWADELSLAALGRVARDVAERDHAPLLIVGVARPALYERLPAWGRQFPAHTRLDLAPLVAADTRRLAEELLRKARAAPDELYAVIVSRAEGNPYYVEELIKMLIDDRVIRTASEPWQIVFSRAGDLRVPETLTGVLQARLDTLTPAEREVLQHAAVIGRTFWDAAVAYLGARQPGDPAARSPGAELAVLCDREIIFSHEPPAFAGTREYLFRHQLMRDVVYDSVLRRDRRAVHGRAARWLAKMAESSGRADEYAAEIAEHYDLAGETRPARDWYARAGRRAAAQAAHGEALRYLTLALELTDIGELEQRFELLTLRERVYDLQGTRNAQLADLRELEALASQPQAGDDAAAPAWRQAAVALRRASYGEATSDYAAAAAAAERAVALAHVAGVAESEAAGHLLWALALRRLSDYPGAREHLEQALGLAQVTGNRAQQAEVRLNLGVVEFYQGRYTASQRHLAEALDLYRALGDRRGESSTLNNLGNAAWSLGECGIALGYYEQALQRYREIGDRRGESGALGNLGAANHELGKYAAARAYYEQALGLCRRIGDRLAEDIVLGNLGLLLHVQGDDLGAREYSRQAAELAESLGARENMGYALTYLGHVLAGLAHYDESVAVYQRALDLRRELGQANLAAETLAGLARVALARGDTSAALAHVEQIVAYLAQGSLEGVDEPFRVYLTCYRVLCAAGDPRAPSFLNTTMARLQEQAARINDVDARRSFLDNVPAHRELLAEQAAR
jgi:predicted ATPase/class 3 adenylate cyclase